MLLVMLLLLLMVVVLLAETLGFGDARCAAGRVQLGHALGGIVATHGRRAATVN